MSVEELKDRIAQLSPSEQDDVRQYIDMLQSNVTTLDPLTESVWQEIERRELAYQSGKQELHSAKEVLSRLKRKQS